MVSNRRCAQMGLGAASLVLASSLGVLLAWSPPRTPIVYSAPTGQPAPSFRLRDLDGVSHDSAGLLGKAVVVFFSSNRCDTCDDYQSRLSELAQQYRSDPRVQFLALNQDVSAGDQKQLLEVRVSTKVLQRPFPTLLDIGGKTASRFGARPAQVAVMDGAGELRYLGGFDDNRDASKVTRHYVAEALRSVLDEMPTALASR